MMKDADRRSGEGRDQVVGDRDQVCVKEGRMGRQRLQSLARMCECSILPAVPVLCNLLRTELAAPSREQLFPLFPDKQQLVIHRELKGETLLIRDKTVSLNFSTRSSHVSDEMICQLLFLWHEFLFYFIWTMIGMAWNGTVGFSC